MSGWESAGIEEVYDQLEMILDHAPWFTEPQWLNREEGTQTGQAWVCKAEDRRLRRKVAIKTPKRDQPPEQQRQQLARLEREAVFLARLHHSNVVPLHSFGLIKIEGEPQPVMGLVMKLIEHRSLREALEADEFARDKQGLRRAADLVAQIADALHHVHERGVIHRDVKPENILLEKRGAAIVPMLGDFGYAKELGAPNDDEEPSSSISRSHVKLTGALGAPGTPPYMSPEQAQRRPGLDERTDIFSLGLVLYEIATGEQAFTYEEIRDDGVERPPRPRKIKGHIDRRFEAICLKALAKERTARYQTAGELARDLRDWVADRPIQNIPPNRLHHALWSFGLYCWRHRNKGPLAAAVVALLVVLGVYYWGQAEQESRDKCFRSLALAERELSVERVLEAEDILDGSCQEDGQRGFEWRYLRRRVGDDPRKLRGQQGVLFSAVFSHDDRLLATVGLDGIVTRWDPIRGTPVDEPAMEQQPADDRHPLHAAAFSPDGATFAAAGGGRGQSGEAEGRILVWDTKTWQLKNTITLDQNVWSIAFSPDGATIVAGCALLERKEGGSVRTYAVAGKSPLWKRELGSRVFSVAYHPRRKLIAAGGEESRVHLLDAVSGTEQKVLEASARPGRVVRSLAFSPHEARDLLAAASGAAALRETGDIRVWSVGGDWETWLEDADGLGDHPGHADEGGGVAFTPDGKRLASGGFDRTVKIWNLEKLAQPRETLTLRSHLDHVRAVAFSHRGDLLASAGEDRTAVIWDARQSGSIREDTETHPGVVWQAAFASGPAGAIVAVNGARGAAQPEPTVEIYGIDAHRPVRTLSGQTDHTRAMALTRDGRWLASGSYDGTVFVWDLASQEPPRQVTNKDPGWLNAVALDAQAATLAVARGYGIELWDLRTPAPAPSELLEGHSWITSSVAFAPEPSRLLASGSWDQTVRLWDRDSGEQVALLEGHHGRINDVAFSPDGGTLATASNDATIKIWRVEGRVIQELRTLAGHSDAVLDLAFSPDGALLASASQDQTVRTWDIEQGVFTDVLRRHAARLRGLTFGRTSRELIVAVGNETKTRDANQGGGFEILTLGGP